MSIRAHCFPLLLECTGGKNKTVKINTNMWQAILVSKPPLNPSLCLFALVFVFVLVFVFISIFVFDHLQFSNLRLSPLLSAFFCWLREMEPKPLPKIFSKNQFVSQTMQCLPFSDGTVFMEHFVQTLGSLDERRVLRIDLIMNFVTFVEYMYVRWEFWPIVRPKAHYKTGPFSRNS